MKMKMGMGMIVVVFFNFSSLVFSAIKSRLGGRVRVRLRASIFIRVSIFSHHLFLLLGHDYGICSN
jgi:uncharacterized membrane protein